MPGLKRALQNGRANLLDKYAPVNEKNWMFGVEKKHRKLVGLSLSLKGNHEQQLRTYQL